MLERAPKRLDSPAPKTSSLARRERTRQGGNATPLGIARRSAKLPGETGRLEGPVALSGDLAGPVSGGGDLAGPAGRCGGLAGPTAGSGGLAGPFARGGAGRDGGGSLERVVGSGPGSGSAALVSQPVEDIVHRGTTMRTPQETTARERHTETPHPYVTATATTWGSRGITTDRPTPSAAPLAPAAARGASQTSPRAERQPSQSSCASSLTMDRRRPPLSKTMCLIALSMASNSRSRWQNRPARRAEGAGRRTSRVPSHRRADWAKEA